MLGWSYYSLEGALTSCSVEWKDKSWNVITYNITIFVFVFIIPFLSIMLIHVKIIIKVMKLIFKSISEKFYLINSCFK